MPTYQYECTKCGHSFEILQSMSESRLRKCPKCAKFSLERLIGTGSGIIFKGKGFYETDYKQKEPVASTKDAKPESPAAAPKSHGCSPNCGCA